MSPRRGSERPAQGIALGVVHRGITALTLRAKAMLADEAFALSGRMSHAIRTQGVALGQGLVGLSGR